MAAARDDLWQRGAHRAHDAVQVDVQHAIEILGVHAQERPRRVRGDAGIGDHQIQTAESGHRLLDGGLRGRFNPHVGNQSQRAVGADLSDGALDAVIVDVRDDHARVTHNRASDLRIEPCRSQHRRGRVSRFV